MRRSSLRLSLLALLGATVVTLSSNCLPDLHPLVGRPCDSAHACVDSDLVCCEGTCQLLSSAGACPVPGGDGGSDGGLDGGLADGGVTGDGGLPDAGPVPDAGTSDAGPLPDAGTSDAGPLPDAGPSDAGCPPNLLASGSFELNEDADEYGDKGAGQAGWTSQFTRTGTGALKVDKDRSDSNTVFGIELSNSVLTSLEVGPTYCLSAWVNRGSTPGDLPVEFTAHRYGASSSEQAGQLWWSITDNAWRLYLVSSSLTTQYSRSLTFRLIAPSDYADTFFVDDARVWKSPDGTCDERCAP